MRNPWDIIKELESTSSRLEKEAIILREAEDQNDIFFEGIRYALDPMITFGVKQVDKKEDRAGVGLAWTEFRTLLNDLRNRDITGLLAKDFIDLVKEKSYVDHWNYWYHRILIKDLRCGVSDKTINKVVEKKYANYTVPTFTCQLAHDSANHEGKLAGKKLVEVKLDGVRVITVVYPDGRVLQFSRNGKELVNFPHIVEQFSKTVTGITEPTVFDGEVMSSSFQDLMKQVHRKSDVQSSDATLHLFDFLPLSAFEQGHWDRSQSNRSEKLTAWKDLWFEETPNIEVVGFELVDLDSQTGQQRFKEINAQAIAGGYEGIMIKDPSAPYECKRTTSWLKLKPFIEVTLEVKDVEEGTGRNIGRLGALVCEGDDDSRHIRVNVGSGFSDSDRDTFWNSRSDVLGKLVEVRADAITQNQDGSYSLRFPRFLHFRGFENGEKI